MKRDSDLLRALQRWLWSWGLWPTKPRARDYRPGDLIWWEDRNCKAVYIRDSPMTYEGVIQILGESWYTGGVDLRRTKLVKPVEDIQPGELRGLHIDLEKV